MSTLNKTQMIQSYNWTSFSPEKRGEADFNYYTQLLAEDLATLLAAPQGITGNYERKFCERVMLIFARQSRCASPAITGPANFNNRRNGKAWDSRDRAVSDFDHWRKKYINAATRERTLSPEAEIDKTLESIDRLTHRRDAYKAANKLKTREAREEYLKEHKEFSPRTAQNMDYGQGAIPAFCITSLTTMIRERNKKLEAMRSRIETKASFEDIKVPDGRISLENDRVIVAHNEKPSSEVLHLIKSHGFKYSPKFKQWVRKHTENAIYSAERLGQALNKVVTND